MFRVGEIVKATGGRLFSGDPRLRVDGISVDSRTIKREQLFVAIKGNRFDGHDFIRHAVRKGAKAVIGSVYSTQPRVQNRIAYIGVKDTRRALADLSRFHRERFKIPMIAVTGSNGKTTTKDMIACILSSRAKVLKNTGSQNNDIGLPLTLLRLNNRYNIGVLELGTNHFGEISYLSNIAQPDFGIITNIGPAHLEYLRSLSGVYKEKVNLLRYLRPPKIAILNADEPLFRRLIKRKSIFSVTYGIRNKCDFQASEIKMTSKTTVEFVVNSNHERKVRLNTVGFANVYNALAGIAVARLLGWNYNTIRQRLANFVFSPGRLKLIKLNGISFIDDTYNANPASLSEALDVLSRFTIKGRKIFVMSDMLELGSSSRELHLKAGSRVARICDAFISVGRFARLTAHRAVELGLSKDCVFSCRNSREAGELLFKTLKPNRRDLILVKGSRLMKMEEVLNQ